MFIRKVPKKSRTGATRNSTRHTKTTSSALLYAQKAANALLRPNKKRVEKTTHAREEMELMAAVTASLDDTKKTRKIPELNKKNSVIFKLLSDGLSDHDTAEATRKALQDAMELLKEINTLKADETKKEKDAKVNIAALRGESNPPLTSKEKLVMRETELKNATLITQYHIEQFFTKHFSMPSHFTSDELQSATQAVMQTLPPYPVSDEHHKLSPLGEMLLSLSETNTARKQKKLYFSVYPLLTLNDILLTLTKNPPLSEDERSARINQIAILVVLFLLFMAYISMEYYAYSKLKPAEKDLQDAHFNHTKLLAKYKSLKSELDRKTEQYNNVLKDIEALQEKSAALTAELNSTTNQGDYARIQQELVDLNAKLATLEHTKTSISELLTAKQESLELLKTQEEMILATAKEASAIITHYNRSPIHRLTMPFKDTVEDTNGLLQNGLFKKAEPVTNLQPKLTAPTANKSP